MKYLPFGVCRFSQGTIGTDKLFTGQRLDANGLYYYNARYYDATIGRFISADPVIQNPANLQMLNRYSYCTDNPLNYTDPSGHDQVIVTNDDGTYTIMDGDGRFLANATDIDDLAQKMNYVEPLSRQVDLPLQPKAADFFNELEKQEDMARIGLEGVNRMEIYLVKNIPVINVRQGSFLDKALFFTHYAVTIYPIGVFAKQPMDIRTKEEEGYLWNDQKNSKSGLGWVTDYFEQYGILSIIYGGNQQFAYEAISYERNAMTYAANQAGLPYNSLPPVIDYWWKKSLGVK